MDANAGYDVINRLYETLSLSTDNYVYIGDLRTGTFRYPRIMVEEFGLPGEIVEHATDFWLPLIHKEDRKAFLDANLRVAEGKERIHRIEYRVKNLEGHWVWLRCRGRVMEDETGNPVIFAGIIVNLYRYSRMDPVTGLLNRIMAEEEMEGILRNAPAKPCGILVLGFDNFRSINDRFNRAFGDEMMRRMAQRMQRFLPENAQLFRFDGDEYAVIFRDADEQEVRAFYESCQAVLKESHTDGLRHCEPTISAGYAVYPQDGRDYLNIVKKAVYSLEYSKQNGKNRLTLFDRAVLEGRERELLLSEVLYSSIHNGCEGFEMHYQLLYGREKNKIVGAEALTRFSCTQLGKVSPQEFIPVLESSGLICAAGEWVFETAVKTARRYAAWIPDFVIHINISWVQFEKGDFLQYLSRKKQEGFTDGVGIVLELTETCISSNYGEVIRILNALHEMGFQVAMDDFGTGYSSLGLLKEIPVDIVKIDQSFIRSSNMSDSRFDGTFVEFIVKLCHTMNIKVCQEGVETAEQARSLTDKKLDVYQGYLYGKPIPEADFMKLCEQSIKMEKN